MTDTQAEGWRHPERHIARRVERRTPAEMMNLVTLDALIATYGMEADEFPHASCIRPPPVRPDPPGRLHSYRGSWGRRHAPGESRASEGPENEAAGIDHRGDTDDPTTGDNAVRERLDGALPFAHSRGEDASGLDERQRIPRRKGQRP